ncbi:hypothetical protein HDU81_004231 [Chytriomyces hyalinus]|nr:hypothetical protein HDU81_004231 [Chytriomyces hyalinus]
MPTDQTLPHSNAPLREDSDIILTVRGTTRMHDAPQTSQSTLTIPEPGPSLDLISSFSEQPRPPPMHSNPGANTNPDAGAVNVGIVSPPEYSPSALPPSYWSGEMDQSEDDCTSSDSDAATLHEGLGGRLPREIDAAVASIEPRTRKPKNFKRWRKTHRKFLRLRNLKWYALFLIKWDVALSIFLLISTLLLIIPGSLVQGATPAISPAEYLILLIPLLYIIISVFGKRAYSTCTSASNPLRDGPVPPTHFLSLYNVAYLIRCGLDMTAYLKHPNANDRFWTASVIRSAISVATPGVALFFPQLFPCRDGRFGYDDVLDSKWGNATVFNNETSFLNWLASSSSSSDVSSRDDGTAVNWDSDTSANVATLNLGTCVSGKILLPLQATLYGFRVLSVLFLLYYTQRLSRRLLRRLGRNLAFPPVQASQTTGQAIDMVEVI